MAQRLGDVADGRVIKLKENGVLVDFYVAKHDYENGLNGAGRILVVRKDCYDLRQWHSSDVNAYASSAIDTWLNGTYKNLLDADIRGVMGKTKIKYTLGNGKATLSTLERAVFLLSATEFGLSHASSMNVEGTELDSTVRSLLRTVYLNGSKVEQWTRSPLTDYTNDVWIVGGTTSHCSKSYGSRPAFTLPSTLSVSDEGIVSLNTAPTVTASTTSLGVQNEPFSWSYKVSDPEGDTISVGEYLDGRLVNTRRGATSGSTLTFGYTNDKTTFRQIANGDHTLTVIPSDSSDSGASLTASWTKAVYTASVTLAEPLSVAGDIEVALLSVSGSIPEDANYKVEVTNNAKDNSPVWQDCTEDVKAGENIVFANRTSANGAAFNFRITVSRGASGVGGYIDAVRGAFQ